MTPEEFKQWGYRFVDWVADYLSHPGTPRRSLKREARRYPKAASAKRRPKRPNPLNRVLQDLDRIIVPGLDALESSVVSCVLPEYGL